MATDLSPAETDGGFFAWLVMPTLGGFPTSCCMHVARTDLHKDFFLTPDGREAPRFLPIVTVKPGTYIEWHNCCYIGNVAQMSLLGIGGSCPVRRVPSTEPRQATKRGFAFSSAWNQR